MEQHGFERVVGYDKGVGVGSCLHDHQPTICCERLNALEAFDFGCADFVCSEGEGRLHCHQRRHLQQVVLHHVPGNGLVVKKQRGGERVCVRVCARVCARVSSAIQEEEAEGQR